MRRSGPVGGGGGGGSGGVGAGVGGFSKPPPAPLTHGSTGRVRLHTPELNGTLSKDRSPREQSPSLVVSPSHPGSREKSPNPASQDLHDCSMCLSAYIQSLNTVCGTACRLSQCLSQASGGEAAREAAEGWEWVARAVGVASAAVKTQSLVLLQDAQSRQQDSPDVTRRHHLHRVSQAMLTSFLGLQYQFSALVVERFTPLLQALRDDLPTPTSVPTPVPASGHFSNKGAGGTGGPGLLESPNKDDGKNPSRHPSGNHPRPNPSAWSSPMGPTSYNVGPVGGYGGGGGYIPYSPANTLSPGACYNFYGQQSGAGVAAGAGWGSEATYRRWSMGGPTVGDGWDGRGGGVGGTGGGLGPFSLIANRRWSVPEASEGGEGTGAGTGGTGELYGALGGEGWGGGSSPGWGSRSSGLHLPSRDSSVTRSPSHSPSLTPDPSRQGSFISNEELEEVIDLLSLPLSPLEIGGKEGEGGEGMGRRSGGGCGVNKGGPVSPLALSPSHHHNPPIAQLFEEAGKQQQLSQPPQPPVKPLQPPATQHQHQQPPPPQQQPHQQQKQQQQQPFQDMQYHHQQTQQQPPAPPQQFQDLHYHSQPPPQPSSSQQPQFNKASTTSRQSLGEIVVEAPECDSQVSTPIWPPSGIAPGVTLTECSSAEEKADLLPWTDGVGCERRSNVSAAARDSATRASWPATATLLWAGLDSLLGGGSEEEGDDGGAGEDRRSANAAMVAATQYRRHSTDTTHLLATHPPTHLPKTRSSDNITAGTTTNHSNGGGGTEVRRRGGGAGSSTPSSCLDTNLQQLLLLNSLLPSSNSSSSPPPPPPPPPPCTSTSQYSLFSPTS